MGAAVAMGGAADAESPPCVAGSTRGMREHVGEEIQGGEKPIGRGAINGGPVLSNNRTTPQVSPTPLAIEGALADSNPPLAGRGRETRDAETIEQGRSWKKRSRRKLRGNIIAHALFLQHFFRRSRVVKPGCWSQGGLAGVRVFRPPLIYGCGGGQNLAPEGAFDAQKRLALRGTAWYANYVMLLRKLRSGRRPAALVTYCGQGGVTEGIRRVWRRPLDVRQELMDLVTI